jgi:tetratricopeptide (TPR) repeat protein
MIAVVALAAAFFNGYVSWPLGRAREAGGLEGAIAEFQRAIELEPGNAGAYRHLSLAYKLGGRPDDAIAAYQKAAEANPEAGWPRVGLGQLYLEENRVEEAIAEFKQAIELEPDNADAYTYLGQVYLTQGGLEAAISVHEQAIEANPGQARPHLGLGDVYLAEGEIERALAAYRQAIAVEPDYGYGYVRLGDFYKAQGMLEEAIAEYQKAIWLEPRIGWYHVPLGQVYLSQGETEKALAQYKEAIRIEPASGWPHAELGNLYRAEGRIEEAIAEYQEAIQLEPGNFWYRLFFGRAYKGQDMANEAVAQYLAAIRLAPASEKGMDLYMEAAEVCLSADDFESAESVLDNGQTLKARARAWEILTLDPKNETAIETLLYYDFIDHLDQAQIDAPREPFEHVKVTEFVMPFNGDLRRVLFMHPEARVSYQIKLPSEPSVLRFSLAMSPECWSWGGDGAIFEMHLRDESRLDRLLFSKHVSNEPEDRRWHDEEVDLEPYAGQQVEITFVTGPGPGADFTGDLAGWATPRILLR